MPKFKIALSRVVRQEAEIELYADDEDAACEEAESMAIDGSIAFLTLEQDEDDTEVESSEEMPDERLTQLKERLQAGDLDNLIRLQVAAKAERETKEILEKADARVLQIRESVESSAHEIVTDYDPGEQFDELVEIMGEGAAIDAVQNALNDTIPHMAQL